MRNAAATAELPSQSEAVLRAADRSPARNALDPLSPLFSDAVNIAVARALRVMQRRSGLSLTRIASRASTHRPIVGRVLRGKHTVTLDTCKRIATACGGDVREVLEAIDKALGLGSTKP